MKTTGNGGYLLEIAGNVRKFFRNIMKLLKMAKNSNDNDDGN